MTPLLAASGRFRRPVWHPRKRDGDRFSGVQAPCAAAAILHRIAPWTADERLVRNPFRLAGL